LYKLNLYCTWIYYKIGTVLNLYKLYNVQMEKVNNFLNLYKLYNVQAGSVLHVGMLSRTLAQASQGRTVIELPNVQASEASFVLSKSPLIGLVE